MTLVFPSPMPKTTLARNSPESLSSVLPYPDLRLHTFVIMAQLDVDHARDRVRTVGGGSAVFQNFNAFDRGFRNRTQIEERGGSTVTNRVRRHTTAIDQEQGLLRAEAAQRNRRRTRGESGSVVGNRHTTTVGDRKILDQVLPRFARLIC